MRRWHRTAVPVAVLAAGTIAAGLAAAGVIPAITGRSSASDSAAPPAAAPTSTAVVQRRDLSAQVNVDGTLGYAGSYPVINHARGTVTAVPGAGDIIRQGRALYQVDGKPVVLLYGSTVMYRVLAEGASPGPDTRQLNADLIELGYASSHDLRSSSDEFSTETARAVQKLQADLGLDQTGGLDPAQVVFFPGPVRVTAVESAAGALARPGMRVLDVSSTRRAVNINLDAAMQAAVAQGDAVVVTLPGGKTTPGMVTYVGKVATSTKAGSAAGSTGPTSTIQVQVTPSRPADTGILDQAPVQVAITTSRVRNTLVVPVNALMALADGTYAVEVAGTGVPHRLVPITARLFDDADGLVAVTASGLSAGMRVVVPSV